MPYQPFIAPRRISADRLIHMEAGLAARSSAWMTANFQETTLSGAANATLPVDPDTFMQVGNCFEPDTVDAATVYVLQPGIYVVSVELCPGGAAPSTAGDLKVSLNTGSAQSGSFYDRATGAIWHPYRGTPLVFRDAILTFPPAYIMGDYDGSVKLTAAYLPAGDLTIDAISTIQVVRIAEAANVPES